MPASTTIAKLSKDSDRLTRRAERRPVAVAHKKTRVVVVSARAYQKLTEIEEQEEDRYWLDAISKMSPKDRETIGVKKTRKLLNYVTKGK